MSSPGNPAQTYGVLPGEPPASERSFEAGDSNSPLAQRRRSSLFWACFFNGALLLSFVLPVGTLQSSPVIICSFRGFFGVPCPGCGMTRAFCAISHGHPIDALGFHWLSPLIYGMFVILGISHLLFLLLDVDWLAAIDRVMRRITLPIFVVVFTYWIVKVIHFFGWDSGLQQMVRDSYVLRWFF